MANGGGGGGGFDWGSIAAIVASFLANQQGGRAENSLIFPPTILPPDYPFQQSLWQDYMPGLMGQQIPSFEQAGGIFGGPSSPMQQMANLMMQQQSTSQPMFMGGVAGSLGNLAGQTYDPGSADQALERFLAPNFIDPSLTDPWAQAQTASPFSIGGGTENRTPFPSPGEGWGEINLGMSPGILGGPMGGGGPPPGGDPGGGKKGPPPGGDPGGGGKDAKPPAGGGGGIMKQGGGFPQQSLFTPTGMGAHKSSSSPLAPGAPSGSSPMAALAMRSGADENEDPTGGKGPPPPMPTFGDTIDVIGEDPGGPQPGDLGSGIPSFPRPDPNWTPPGGDVYGGSSPGAPIDITTKPPPPDPEASDEEKIGWVKKMWRWIKENVSIGMGGGLLAQLMKQADLGGTPGDHGLEGLESGGEGEEPPLGPPGGGLEEQDECPPGSINLGGQCIPLGDLGGGGGDGPGGGDKPSIQGQDQIGEGGWWVYPGLERPALPDPSQLFQFQPSTFDFSNFTQWQNPNTQLPVAQPGAVDPSSGWF